MQQLFDDSRKGAGDDGRAGGGWGGGGGVASNTCGQEATVLANTPGSTTNAARQAVKITADLAYPCHTRQPSASLAH